MIKLKKYLSAFVLLGLVLSSCKSCPGKKEEDKNKHNAPDRSTPVKPDTKKEQEVWQKVQKVLQQVQKMWDKADEECVGLEEAQKAWQEELQKVQQETLEKAIKRATIRTMTIARNEWLPGGDAARVSILQTLLEILQKLKEAHEGTLPGISEETLREIQKAKEKLQEANELREKNQYSDAFKKGSESNEALDRALEALELDSKKGGHGG